MTKNETTPKLLKGRRTPPCEKKKYIVKKKKGHPIPDVQWAVRLED